MTVCGRVLFSLLGVICLTGCGRGCAKTQEMVTEAIVEKAIENAAASSGEEIKGVDIKFGEGEFKIRTSEGSFQLGEDLALPANFPKVVPVYKGAEVVQFSQMEQGASIIMKSPDDRADILSFYKTTLEAAGWSSRSNIELPTGDMMQYEIGRTNLSVMIVDAQDERLITIALIGT